MNTLSTILSKTIDAALALFYPHPCDVCGGSVETRFDGCACRFCWESTGIFSLSEHVCGKCGQPLEAGTAVFAGPANCGRCSELNFDSARACGIYEKALRASVLRLKNEPNVSPAVSRLMVSNVRQHPLSDATLVLAVPLHEKRFAERGFNQADVLAQTIAKGTGLPYFSDVIVRTQHSERHRAGMDAHSRHKSVKNVFEVRKPRLIADCSVLLVDDVFTTGATVSECARVLKESGAAAVYVLTLARPSGP